MQYVYVIFEEYQDEFDNNDLTCGVSKSIYKIVDSEDYARLFCEKQNKQHNGFYGSTYYYEAFELNHLSKEGENAL